MPSTVSLFKHSVGRLLTAVLPLVLAASSWSATGNSNSVRQTYLPEDFSRFAPRSALDMVRQIPGFSLNDGEGERGFGQADTNVLINHRRVSGKSNGPRQALERLSVESVIRLEILDGASLDIGGLSGQVLNVVTSSQKQISGRYSYSPRIRPTGKSSEERWREFSVSLTGSSEGSDWTLGIANEQRSFGDYGPEVIADGAGRIVEYREETGRRQFDRPNI